MPSAALQTHALGGPARGQGEIVAFPYLQARRGERQRPAEARAEGAVLDRADRRDAFVEVEAFLRAQHVARGAGVEHAQGNVGALGDVLEESQHAFAAMQFHRRGLDIDHVGAGFLGVQRQLQAVLGRHRGGAGLDHDLGIDRPGFLDRHFEQTLALGDRQRPEFGEPAGQPQQRMAERADAIAHQLAVGMPVDVIAVRPRERRVERIPDAFQRARRPLPRFVCSCHGAFSRFNRSPS